MPNETRNAAFDLVLQFCDAFGKGATPTELVEYFADDAVYHNIPVEPAVGREAILGLLNMFLTPAERCEFACSTSWPMATPSSPSASTSSNSQTPLSSCRSWVTFEVRDGKIARGATTSISTIHVAVARASE